jgi:predicted HD superfamily hydrolase involved in NAD metabolism
MKDLYTDVFEKQVQKWAEGRIASKRIRHVQGVVETVDSLARQYAPDEVSRARLAGWIHDAAKHLPDEELLLIAEEHDWPITETERMVPMLLHGVVGYFQAADEFGIDDPILRNACAYHTTGAPDMNTLDKIVMVGDLIEPTRNYEGVEDLRQLTMKDLDGAVLQSVDGTFLYLIKRQRIIDPRPLQLRNQLLMAGVRYK